MYVGLTILCITIVVGCVLFMISNAVCGLVACVRRRKKRNYTEKRLK